MKVISKLAYLFSGLGIVGSAWLWILAASSGFSSNHIVCFASGSSSCVYSLNPFWLSSTTLWLAPLVIIAIIASWIFPALLLPKNTPAIISIFVVVSCLIGVSILAMAFAAGNGL